MIFQISYFSIAFLTAAVSGLAAILVWRKMQAPGSIFLFLMMLAVSEWNLADFMETSDLQLANRIIWSKIAYLGVHMAPVLFLLFALDYTGRSHWLTRRNISIKFKYYVFSIMIS